MSLRLGCVLLGYFIILHGFANVYLVVLEYGQICHRMIMIWILHAQINIIAGILLLTVAYNVSALKSGGNTIFQHSVSTASNTQLFTARTNSCEAHEFNYRINILPADVQCKH